MGEQKIKAQPFVKWVGGKRKLVLHIAKYYPFDKTINTYIEPFVGGGAVLFDVLSKYKLKKVIISDNNQALVNTYKVVKNNLHELKECLSDLHDSYANAKADGRQKIYYQIRDLFNQSKSLEEYRIVNAARFIFLNKTCFNGLYRENSQGLFNCPIGNYKNPKIFDEKKLTQASCLLKNVQIYHQDYKACLKHVDRHSFVYIDPPYRPISKTSSFNKYLKDGFDDKEQLELKEFIDKINDKGALFLLSNSDPTNTDANDLFFDKLYSNYFIKRVSLQRLISSKASSRVELRELLIHNLGYKND